MPVGTHMPRRVTDDQKLEIKRLSDIVKVIQEYVPLKKAGANWKACCPFHEEKTPSFIVSPSRQTFRCFGCQVGGDVFEFVMKYERVDFPEALRMLADRAGVKLRYNVADGPAAEEKAELYRLCEWAATFFMEQLGEREGAEARKYVEKRKLDPAMIAEFRLGYAPDAWDRLSCDAKRAGFPEALIVKAGLAIRRESGGIYDRFRHRLIFPIEDARGRVIGFGGRSLDGSEPKYLNSPETPLFQKGRHLYALPQAREAAMKEGKLAVMEGYTDAIMAHQHGVKWVVATLGTALTRDHIGLIRRYASEALVVFDGDEAGRKASERSLDMFLAEDFPMKVASMPEGLDPCDCLLERGLDVFVECLERAQELFEYRIALSKQRNDISTVAGKSAAIDEMLASLAVMTNPAQRQIALRRLSEEFWIEESALVERLRSRGVKGMETKAGKASGGGRVPGEAAKKGPDRVERAAQDLIESVLTRPEWIREARERIAPSDLPASWSHLLEQVARSAERVQDGAISDLLALVEDRAAAERLAAIADEGARKGGDARKRFDGAVGFFERVRGERLDAEERSRSLAAVKSSNADMSREALRALQRMNERKHRTKKPGGDGT